MDKISIDTIDNYFKFKDFIQNVTLNKKCKDFLTCYIFYTTQHFMINLMSNRKSEKYSLNNKLFDGPMVKTYNKLNLSFKKRLKESFLKDIQEKVQDKELWMKEFEKYFIEDPREIIDISFEENAIHCHQNDGGLREIKYIDHGFEITIKRN